jgi:hypothetical protein
VRHGFQCADFHANQAASIFFLNNYTECHENLADGLATYGWLRMEGRTDVIFTQGIRFI